MASIATVSEAADDRLPPLTDGRVRTFRGRKGKLSELSLDRLDRLGPRWELPPGPLEGPLAFGRIAPLVLEIGSGYGAAASAYATAHPGHDLVAVDVHVPGIARLLGLADMAGLTNLRVVRGDAVEVRTDRIAPARLAAVHLFFPDPWPKEKHRKRRFVGAHTLDLLASRLAPGGQLLVATDQTAYAEHVVTQVGRHGVFEATITERPVWRPTDGFEAKGIRAGRAITDLRVTRRVERATRIELA